MIFVLYIWLFTSQMFIDIMKSLFAGLILETGKNKSQCSMQPRCKNPRFSKIWQTFIYKQAHMLKLYISINMQLYHGHYSLAVLSVYNCNCHLFVQLYSCMYDIHVVNSSCMYTLLFMYVWYACFNYKLLNPYKVEIKSIYIYSYTTTISRCNRLYNCNVYTYPIIYISFSLTIRKGENAWTSYYRVFSLKISPKDLLDRHNDLAMFF